MAARKVVHFEINGTNLPSLINFYSDLFGWHIQHMPEMGYGMIDPHAGEGIGGGLAAPETGFTGTIIYIEVPDPQKTLDALAKDGCGVIVPVTEIPGVVTFAVFSDPQGNTVGLVKEEPPSPDMPQGPSAGTNPSVTWFELVGPDGKALRDFYAKHFEWTYDVDEKFDYGMVEAGIGGGVGRHPQGENAGLIYVKVPDLKDYLKKAETLGGKTLMEPMSVGETTIAHFADPQGNLVGLFTN